MMCHIQLGLLLLTLWQHSPCFHDNLCFSSSVQSGLVCHRDSTHWSTATDGEFIKTKKLRSEFCFLCLRMCLLDQHLCICQLTSHFLQLTTRTHILWSLTSCVRTNKRFCDCACGVRVSVLEGICSCTRKQNNRGVQAAHCFSSVTTDTL